MTPLEQLLATSENEYDAGLGTTTDMWDVMSEILAGADEKLPESLNRAIVALRDGKAKIIGQPLLGDMAKAVKFFDENFYST